MVQDTQQQDGASEANGKHDVAKLQLPTGEILELPMLVVLH